MTDSYTPTTAYPADPQADAAYPTEPPRVPRDQHKKADITPERPQRHPVAYAALVLSIISLLWLAILSSMSGDDNTFERVRVGTQDCVSVPQSSGPAGLYCRTDGVVK